MKPSFEHAVLEADIDRLVREIQEHRERPEMKSAGDKEIIKAALASLHKRDIEGAGAESSAEDSSKSPMPAYINDFSDEAKLEVEYLLDLVAHKGLMYAHAKAKKASAAVLDAFHDALAGKLHLALEERGAFR